MGNTLNREHGLHLSPRVPLARGLQSRCPEVDIAEQVEAVTHLQPITLDFSQPHSVLSQQLAQIDQLSSALDLTVLPHASYLLVCGIFDWPQDWRVDPLRRLIGAGRRLSVQSFMTALFIKLLPECL